MKKLTPLDEALTLALGAAEPIDRTEELPLALASGRVAAESVRADLDVPPFDRAAMDGYAVRALDVKDAPAKLSCVGKVLAGGEAQQAVSRGTCVAVATGSPMPGGADSVVMVEHTHLEGDIVTIEKPIAAGKNVALKGEDIKTGEVVLEAGSVLNPGRLGALAAVGRMSVSVYEKPTALVIPTGGEVVPPGSGPLKPGQIYDINTTTLLAALGEFGAEAEGHPVVEDEMDKLLGAAEKGSGSDLLIMTGGSSVGERDLLGEVLSQVGEMLFHGLAVKPGKPTLMARRKGSRQLIVGMPGYPSSCLSNAYIVLGPLVARLGRRPAPRLQTVELPLAANVPAASGRLQIFTVSLRDGQAHPAFKTSGAITSMSRADGYIEVPADGEGFKAGTLVTVKLF